MERWYLDRMDREMTRLELIRMRKTARLSQEELASALGCAASRISGVEVGRLGVNPDDVDAWATACGFKAAVHFLPVAEGEAIEKLTKEVMELSEEKRVLVENLIRALKG
jgi:transcriptional regulator with XRE-family HTH domain